nr:hypothetical protein [Kutzneria sp. 744]
MRAVLAEQVVELPAAGDQHMALRAARQQRADLGERTGVVQHDQRPPIAQNAAVERRPLLDVVTDEVVGNAQRAQETAEHGLGARADIGEQLAVRELVGDAVRPVHRQPRLADTGAAGDQPDGQLGVADHAVQRGDLVRAAGEAVHVGRQLRGTKPLSQRRIRRAIGTGSGGGQRRVVAQDRVVHLAQRGTEFEPELVDGQALPVPERAQRLGPAAGPVLGQHELRAGLLAQWVFAHERGQLADQVVVLAQIQADRRMFLVRGEPQLLQAGRLDLHR